MILVSRELDYARLQRDGRYRCRVSAIDNTGRNYTHGPFFAADLVVAAAVRDGFEPDWQRVELQVAVDAIIGAEDLDAFTVWEHQTSQDGYRLVLQNEDTSIDVAVVKKTVAEIESLTGWDTVQATTYRNEAVRLNDGEAARQERRSINGN
jgi:hypothetical protein